MCDTGAVVLIFDDLAFLFFFFFFLITEFVQSLSYKWRKLS